MGRSGRNILKWIILVLLLVYAAGISVWANREASNHVCTGIEVEVEGKNSDNEGISRGIDKELHRYPQRIVGTRLHELNVADIERFITECNNFESVNCVISPKGKLIVKIVPLVPVMRVFYGDNSYYINKEGKHIESNAEFYSEVPIVTGAFHKNFTPRALLPLVNYISHDPMLAPLVSMVEARDANNLILVPKIRGHVVNFGDTTRLDEKKKALAMFYRQVMPYKGWNEYDTISVKFRGQVVATRRDKTRLNVAESYLDDDDLEEGTLQDVDETKLPGGSSQPEETEVKKPQSQN